MARQKSTAGTILMVLLALALFVTALTGSTDTVMSKVLSWLTGGKLSSTTASSSGDIIDEAPSSKTPGGGTKAKSNKAPTTAPTAVPTTAPATVPAAKNTTTKQSTKASTPSNVRYLFGQTPTGSSSTVKNGINNQGQIVIDGFPAIQLGQLFQGFGGGFAVDGGGG